MARMDPDQQGAFDLVKRLLGTREIALLKVKAGAGSGKTFTSTRMIKEAGDDCVGTSFTRKAGDELAHRVRAIAPRSKAFLGTTHRYAGRVLRAHDPQAWSMGRCLSLPRRDVGLPSEALIWSAIVEWNRDGIPGLKSRCLNLKLPAGLSWKDYALAAGKVYGAGIIDLDGHEAQALIHGFGDSLPDFHKAFRLFRRSTKALGAWTFDQQLHAGFCLLMDGKGPRPPAVFVDEAQDNNRTQLRFAAKLAERGLLVLIGDARQSIYSFRGAAVDTFINAQELVDTDYLYEVELGYNYRSGIEIVQAANAMVRGEDWADGSESKVGRTGARAIVRDWHEPDIWQAVAGEVLAAVNGRKVKAHETAILCRTNGDATEYEMSLRAAGLKVNRLGAPPFVELPLPSAFLMWLVLSVEDDLEALDLAKNTPQKRFLGHAFIPAVLELQGKASNLIGALGMLGPKFRGAEELAKTIAALRRITTWSGKVEAVTHMFVSTLPPVDPDKTTGPRSMLAALKRMALRMKGPEDVWDLVEAPGDTSNDGVVVSTVHRSKGLEWTRVYVDARAKAYEGDGEAEPTEAERAESGRLAYVALTRARDEVVLITPGDGMAEFFCRALRGTT